MDAVSRKVLLGLEALREEPLEPRSSIEALKGRILQETMVAPRRPAWVWATPVAASLSLAFWLGLALRPIPQGGEVPAARTVSEIPLETTASLGPNPKPANRPSSLAAPEFKAAETPLPVHAPAGAVAVRGDKGDSPVVSAQPAAMLATDLRPGRVPESSKMARALTAPAAAPVETQEAEEQIVLIHSTEDTETGAASAVELESSANVLVGG